VLLLNPPVNLYTSITNLDKLVQTEVKGINNSTTFYELVLNKLTRYFQQRLHRPQRRPALRLPAVQAAPDQRTDGHADRHLVPLLGGRHRLHLRPDQPPRPDHPPKYPITEGTSLTPFLKRALQCDFDCYLTEQVIPMWRARTDGGSLLQLIDQVSLYALKDYLHDSPKIAVMHNADDVILGPGDLGFLRKTFGDRLTVYPLGGHCGNLNYRVNSDAMLEFFRG
jgi:hypothetical protein